MFLRVRGRGACPENSQAALMHLRGFRHVNCPPPQGSYTCVDSATAYVSSSSSSVSGASRPFLYSDFSMGIQAPDIVNAQNAYAESSTTPAVMPNVEMYRMIWKETWNVYDICYDEVELMPADYTFVNAQLARLASIGHSGDGEAEVAKVAALPEGFTLPSKRFGAKSAVVCTHYFAQDALTTEALAVPAQSTAATITLASLQNSRTAAAAAAGPVLVVDLSSMDVSTAHNKLAVELAWVTAFASIQMENPVVTARAIVVRMPYDAMPTIEQLTRAQGLHQERLDQQAGEVCSETRLNNQKNNMASATLEMYDFLGEHLAMLHGSCTHEPACAQVYRRHPHPPPACFIGRSEAALVDTITALTRSAHEANEVPSSASADVMVLVGDHILGEDSEARKRAEVLQLASSCKRSMELLVVPLKALIEDEEESWDPYTVNENSRLNYCPCCGCGDHHH